MTGRKGFRRCCGGIVNTPHQHNHYRCVCGTGTWTANGCCGSGQGISDLLPGVLAASGRRRDRGCKAKNDSSLTSALFAWPETVKPVNTPASRHKTPTSQHSKDFDVPQVWASPAYRPRKPHIPRRHRNRSQAFRHEKEAWANDDVGHVLTRAQATAFVRSDKKHQIIPRGSDTRSHASGFSFADMDQDADRLRWHTTSQTSARVALRARKNSTAAWGPTQEKADALTWASKVPVP